MSEERCVMCGRTIPEGRMICPKCDEYEPSFDTTKITIALDKASDVSSFVNLALRCEDDVVVRSGRFAVNAKSLMGLFSLDLSKPLSVEFYGLIPYDVKEGLKKYIPEGES